MNSGINSPLADTLDDIICYFQLTS